MHFIYIPEQSYCLCQGTVTPVFACVCLAAGLTVTLALSVISSLIILVQVKILGQIQGLRLRSLVLLAVVGVHFILIKLPLGNSKAIKLVEICEMLERSDTKSL